MHLHIDSLRWKPPHMHLTQAVYEAAARRYPALAGRLTVTYSWDSEDFEKHMRTANILFAQRFPRENLAACRARAQMDQRAVRRHRISDAARLAAARRGLTNNSGTHAPKAAESVVMAVLMLNARLPEIIAHQRSAKWEQVFSPVAAGKTVTLLGLGNMGRAPPGRCVASACACGACGASLRRTTMSTRFSAATAARCAEGRGFPGGRRAVDGGNARHDRRARA